MNRRGFLKYSLTLGALMAIPAKRALEQIGPKRILRAVKTRAYPGPLRALDHKRISKSARWAG